MPMLPSSRCGTPRRRTMCTLRTSRFATSRRSATRKHHAAHYTTSYTRGHAQVFNIGRDHLNLRTGNITYYNIYIISQRSGDRPSNYQTSYTPPPSPKIVYEREQRSYVPFPPVPLAQVTALQPLEDSWIKIERDECCADGVYEASGESHNSNDVAERIDVQLLRQPTLWMRLKDAFISMQ